MPYDIITISVPPNQHIKALPAIEASLKAQPRKGEFLACLVAEIGELNRILLLHHYHHEADIAADRAALVRSTNPFGIADIIRHMTADTFLPFPFLAPMTPGQHGPIFEVRTYLLKPGGLQPSIEAWEAYAPARHKLSPILGAMYSTSGEVTRFLHIWPYPDLNTRASTRKTAIETGVWPPKGGTEQLITMHTAIYLPASFSPIR